jgi:F-type H+-transporting ATPase subunit delta
MLGASRESLARQVDALDALKGDEGFSNLPGELFSVASLLERERQLRNAFSDSGQPVEVRQAMAYQLLHDRISPLALGVVQSVVSGRWSSDLDLVAAIEELGARAAFARAQADGSLDATEDEIFRFGRAVDASPELQMALTDPALAPSAKSAIVAELLRGRGTAATQEVLSHQVAHLRGRRLDAVVDQLVELAADQRQRVVAEVRVARPLDPEQERRLADVLSRLQGRTVRLNIAVDPTVLGGVHVRIGDEVIDGTVASRLEQARRAVLG